jgi:hypothetical protein
MDGIADFGREQLPVLFAAVVRFAFDMHEDPARVIAPYGIDGRFAHVRSLPVEGCRVFPNAKHGALRARRHVVLSCRQRGTRGLQRAAGGSLSGRFILEKLLRFARGRL